MSKTYIFEPEVPGGLGPCTVMDRGVHPPRVSKLHFVFDGWLGDELVESFPCYLATPALAASFSAAGLTGFELREAQIETSEQFRELYPNRLLPTFRWFHVVGSEANSDFYITRDHQLAGSQRALDVILATRPSGFEFREAS